MVGSVGWHEWWDRLIIEWRRVGVGCWGVASTRHLTLVVIDMSSVYIKGRNNPTSGR